MTFNKAAIFLCFCFFVVPALAEPDRVDTVFEAGTRSSADDFEEEGPDTAYSFRNQRFKARMSRGGRARVGLNLHRGARVYKSAGALNNETLHNQASFSYDRTPAKGRTALWGLDADHKTKRYESPSSESYIRGGAAPYLTLAREGLYRFTARLGLDRYRYRESPRRDQSIYLAKAEGSRTLLDRRLTLLSSLRGTAEEKPVSQRRKNKAEFMGRAEYRFQRPFLRRAALRVNAGRKNTREEDERDVDYDYRYRGLHAASTHGFGEDLDADLAVETVRRRYLGAYPGHALRLVRNGWKRALLKGGGLRWRAGLAGEYKDVDFEGPGEDYLRRSLELNTVCGRRDLWSAGLALEGRRYRYQGGARQTRYYAGLALEAKFLHGALAAGAELNYRLSRRTARPDQEQKGVKLGLGYEF